MPSGYTAGVSDGKVTTFSEFALSCARAFGALIEMRDEPNSAEIPDQFTASTYHQMAIERERAVLATLLAMTPEQAAARAEAEYQSGIAEWDRSSANRLETEARYRVMLAAALAWEPPSPDHAGLKKFMITQLEESIRFDCGPMSDEWKPKRRDGSEWLSAEIKRTQDSIAYHEKHHATEVTVAEERTAWVRQLRDSLDAVRA